MAAWEESAAARLRISRGAFNLVTRPMPRWVGNSGNEKVSRVSRNKMAGKAWRKPANRVSHKQDHTVRS